MDSTEIGTYGTFTVMKSQQPGVALAKFPVDTETITFGRDPDCDVRLYYPSVSALHAKIVSKSPTTALFVVLGVNGALVNGRDVYPGETPSGEPLPVEIPLREGTEFEIHGKRFRWAYPPAAPPPVAVNTPTQKKRLRLSMIQSTQVFSPAPSRDPLANLRVLQTPLKPAFGNRRASSPLKNKTPLRAPAGDSDDDGTSDDDSDDEEILLVEGNHPRVCSEGRDLVIFEDVEQPAHLPATPSRPPGIAARGRTSSSTYSNPEPVPLQEHVQQKPAPVLATPKKKLGRPSLHRAVLIRSAQRAVRQWEEETEVDSSLVRGPLDISTSSSEGGEDSASGAEDGNEDEEMEVDDEDQETEALTPTGKPEGYYNQWELDGYQHEHDEKDEEEDSSDEEEIKVVQAATPKKAGWRKSLEAVKEGLSWVVRGRSKSRERDDEEMKQHMDDDDDDENQDENQDENDNNDNENDENNMTIDEDVQENQENEQATPRGRPRHSLATPRHAAEPLVRPVPATEGPRRVRVEQPWKVRDLARAPLADKAVSIPDAAPRTLATPFRNLAAAPTTPTPTILGHVASVDAAPPQTPTRDAAFRDVTPGSARVSAETREAIRERRRSAWQAAELPFTGYIPGVTPRPSMVPPSPAPMPAPTPSPAKRGWIRPASPTKLAIVTEKMDTEDNEESGKPWANPFQDAAPRTPTKVFSAPRSPTKSRPASPTKSGPASPTKETDGPEKKGKTPVKTPSSWKPRDDSIEEDEDTNAMLQRMKQTVEGLRRRSAGAGLAQTPRRVSQEEKESESGKSFSLLAERKFSLLAGPKFIRDDGEEEQMEVEEAQEEMEVQEEIEVQAQEIDKEMEEEQEDNIFDGMRDELEAQPAVEEESEPEPEPEVVEKPARGKRAVAVAAPATTSRVPARTAVKSTTRRVPASAPPPEKSSAPSEGREKGRVVRSGRAKVQSVEKDVEPTTKARASRVASKSSRATADEHAESESEDEAPKPVPAVRPLNIRKETTTGLKRSTRSRTRSAEDEVEEDEAAPPTSTRSTRSKADSAKPATRTRSRSKAPSDIADDSDHSKSSAGAKKPAVRARSRSKPPARAVESPDIPDESDDSESSGGRSTAATASSKSKAAGPASRPPSRATRPTAASSSRNAAPAPTSGRTRATRNVTPSEAGGAGEGVDKENTRGKGKEREDTGKSTAKSAPAKAAASTSKLPARAARAATTSQTRAKAEVKAVPEKATRVSRATRSKT